MSPTYTSSSPISFAISVTFSVIEARVVSWSCESGMQSGQSLGQMLFTHDLDTSLHAAEMSEIPFMMTYDFQWSQLDIIGHLNSVSNSLECCP
jgi:hypothetical protein